MRIKHHTENLLVIEDKPLIIWIICGGLVIGSVFLIIYSLLDKDLQIFGALVVAAFTIPLMK